MKNKFKILVLNDKAVYNVRYRQHLIDMLDVRGHYIESCGLFEGAAKFSALALRLLSGHDRLVLSSNLKSNLLTLLLCRRLKVIILNGMGRLRGSRQFRVLLRALLTLRQNTVVVVQNNADFRYLQRFCPQVRLFWIPGSGGKAKQVGYPSTAVIVQRDNKIGLVAQDVKALLSELEPKAPLAIVGCRDKGQLMLLFPDETLITPGYVASDDIFRDGGIFVQPSGYGEGFPHTLADALVSKMDVLIADIEFLRYGLGRLGARREPVAPGWSRLIYGQELRDAVATETVTAQVADIFETLTSPA